jgi:hypothetical protein
MLAKVMTVVWSANYVNYFKEFVENGLAVNKINKKRTPYVQNTP